MKKGMKDNVTSLSQEKSTAIAQQMGWSLAFAEGYIAGKSERWRGNLPSSYVVVGVDEYALGFRAGYFARKLVDIENGRSSGKPDIRQSGEQMLGGDLVHSQTNPLVHSLKVRIRKGTNDAEKREDRNADSETRR